MPSPPTTTLLPHATLFRSGQVVNYTLTATNTGNTTQHNVTVSDSPALAGFSCTPSIPVATFAPGATIVCTGSHTITQDGMDTGLYNDHGVVTNTESTVNTD